VEIHSALTRRLREGELRVEGFRKARHRTEGLLAAFSQVSLLEAVCERAVRILDVHPLSAAAALQLAAAIVASKERPRGLPFVTLDGRLAEAAEREGFPVITVEP
jgi:predicted nucleic acid-binding protein